MYNSENGFEEIFDVEKPVSSFRTNQSKSYKGIIVKKWRQSSRKPVYSITQFLFSFLLSSIFFFVSCDYYYKIESILHVISFSELLLWHAEIFMDRRKINVWQCVSCMNNTEIKNGDKTFQNNWRETQFAIQWNGKLKKCYSCSIKRTVTRWNYYVFVALRNLCSRKICPIKFQLKC